MKADIQKAIEFIKVATGQVVTASHIEMHENGRIGFMLTHSAWCSAFRTAKDTMGEPQSQVMWTMALHQWQFGEGRSLHLYAAGHKQMVTLHDEAAK